MLQNLTGMHALVVLAVVVLLFGASKLPALARSVGQSIRVLRQESDDGDPGSSPDEEEEDAESIRRRNNADSAPDAAQSVERRPAPRGPRDQTP